MQTCFLVYEVITSQLSEANTTNHGVQIPLYDSQSSVCFSLMVDSDLFVNQQYLATITAINADGGRNISVIVEFGKNECHSMNNNIIVILTLYDCHINISRYI